IPSSSTMTVPTSPQNSISVCQSRPLRASRDASIANTAPTRPSQIAASRRSKPGRLMPPPELPGTIGEPVLTAAALQIVHELIGRRLADVDKGAAAQMVSRDLDHYQPSWPPAPPRFRSAGRLRVLPFGPSVRGTAKCAALPARTGPAERLCFCASFLAFSILE